MCPYEALYDWDDIPLVISMWELTWLLYIDITIYMTTYEIDYLIGNVNLWNGNEALKTSDEERVWKER